MPEQAPGRFQRLIGAIKGGATTVLAWAASFFDPTQPKTSMKRALMGLAGYTLCRGTIILCKAIAHQVYMGRPVDQGAVYALGTLAVPVAALAGVIYVFHKDKPPEPAPVPAPDKEQP